MTYILPVGTTAGLANREPSGRPFRLFGMIFPTKEVRDVVLKGGLTPKGTSEFYERLDALLGSMA